MNDVQWSGLTTQSLLISILLWLWQSRGVICVDAEKMFWLIWVALNHRIIWREYPDEPLGHYKLATVVYGIASCPFNVVQALQQWLSDLNRTATSLYPFVVLRWQYFNKYTNQLAIYTASGSLMRFSRCREFMALLVRLAR